MDADGKGGGAMCWRENDRWGEIVISSQEDLERLVREWGFVPLLKNWVPCFSVEEHTRPELWSADGVDGPWEWKGPAIQNTGCACGKFFGGKAGFISGEWYPDFANYRRDGYDFDARYATPEAAFGEAFTEKVYRRSPEESRQEIEACLRQLLPWATARQIKWIVG